jgi:hypothetical protein
MMRALPASDITAMLTAVTENYESFVETSGLASQPTDNGAFLSLDSNDGKKSEQLVRRQRMYLSAVGVVFCFVLALTAVSITGVMVLGRLAW